MKKVVWVLVGCAVVLITMGIVIRIMNNEQGISNSEGGRARERGTPRLSSGLAESEKSAQSVEEPSLTPSDAVLTLIDPETDYQTRLGAMRKLGYEISEQDIAALKHFLVAEIPADVGQRVRKGSRKGSNLDLIY